MKKHVIIRCALLLTLCAAFGRGWAQESETVIFSEDFSELTGVKDPLNEYGAWTLNHCAVINRYGADGKYSLKMTSYTNQFYTEGSATTPNLPRMTPSAVLTFSYANAQNSNNGTFIVKTSSGVFVETNTNTYTITTIVKDQSYYTKSLHIRNAESGNTISFTWVSGNSFALSSVVLSPLPLINLYQSQSNTSTLTENEGQIVDVTLERSFPASTWCTLCVPFDVSTASVKAAFGQTNDPELRVFESVDDTKMKFQKTESVTAGTPFLLKLSADSNNPVFTGVTISSTAAQTVTHNSFSFIGTYSPVEVNNSNARFLNASGQLFKLGESETNNTLAGLRAYFTIPSSSNARSLSIDFDEPSTPTTIPALREQPSTLPEATYTLSGQPVESPTTGIYIVRQSDGTTRKVIKK